MVDWISEDKRRGIRAALKVSTDKLKGEFVLVDPDGKPKWLDMYLEVVPSIFEKENDIYVRTVVCLACIMKQKPSCLKFKKSGNIQSHIRDCHPEIYQSSSLRSEFKQKILTDLIRNEHYRKKIRTSSGSEGDVKVIKKEKKSIFRDQSKLKYLEALWLMQSGRPTLLSQDEGYGPSLGPSFF